MFRLYTTSRIWSVLFEKGWSCVWQKAMHGGPEGAKCFVAFGFNFEPSQGDYALTQCSCICCLFLLFFWVVFIPTTNNHSEHSLYCPNLLKQDFTWLIYWDGALCKPWTWRDNKVLSSDSESSSFSGATGGTCCSLKRWQLCTGADWASCKIQQSCQTLLK